jgi:hypothetical protein
VPALVKTRADRAVDDDPEQPGAKRGPFLEAVDSPKQSQPGLLSNLLGYGAASYIAAREPHHRRVMKVDEGRESLLVAGAEPAYQASLVCRIWRDALRAGYAARARCGRCQTFPSFRDLHPLGYRQQQRLGTRGFGARRRREGVPTPMG